MDILKDETGTTERLPWRKPVIERLAVSLDTKNETGSFTDFEGGYSTVPLQG